MSDRTSPRSGDWVRCVEDNRDAAVLEGLLHIRLVPSLGYAQVNVLVDGHPRAVIPESIQVLRGQAASLEELEATDPLVGEAGWRRVVNLEEARSEGLLPPPLERVGGTWDELLAMLHERALPLLEAGWTLTSTDREESWEFGDSVFYDLERDGLILNLEYYEHGQLVAYPVADSASEDEGPEQAEPTFSIDDSTPENTPRAFEANGWLSPTTHQE